MKIVRKSGDTKFGILEHGYVFTFEGFAYIKIFGEKEGSAVNLEDGVLDNINNSRYIKK
jgi:hypothetical protein